jgi:hypothetical protein
MKEKELTHEKLKTNITSVMRGIPKESMKNMQNSI